ncbi:hypothetical protein RB594_000144 [Gaeumannomyces avenae]
MARHFSRARFLAVAVVFHVVYILSIFDIYFVSPIVSGMRLFQIPREPTARAPADRLVLFVGDGLRADKAFQSFPEPYPKTDADLTPRPLAPFLRSRVLEHGTFGVSHTRVPTESRPGHVALIAGLYEDVSAVTTGWKLNPVNFDSVFNRSRHTWSWGSPDILPMFEQGAVPGRVDVDMYDAAFEDFSKQDAYHLDTWVFDHVRDFFAEARRNATLAVRLRQDKIVFFLHLLGIDTAGHGFRPYSKEYLHNIKVVDEGVKEITALIEDFYADDRTAFVFTADHGMSDYGSHGDGHPDNTRTPLVAWGSGVAKPVLHPAGAVVPGHDEYSSDWGFDQVQRHDVAQADVAALMSFLIGVEFPANSVGEVPLPFLSAPIAEKAEAALTNAQGILEMYRVKEEIKRAGELRFRPFGPLRGEEHGGGRVAAERVADIRKLLDDARYEEAIEESAALVRVGLEGLRYLQTYDWLFLRALITIGYLGWMAYALTTVVDAHVLHGRVAPARDAPGVVVFSSVLLVLYASFIMSGSPPTYYAYAFFPVFFWEEIYARRQTLAEGRRVLFAHIKPGASLLSFLINTAMYIGVIVSLALGYIHREVLTGIYIVGSFWPATYGLGFLREHATLSATWFISCLAMSTFTLLPAMKLEDLNLILVGGALMVVIGVAYLVFENWVLSDFSSSKTTTVSHVGRPINRSLVGAQVGLVMLSMLITRSSVLSLQARQGLPLGNQMAGLFVLFTSLFMPVAYRIQPNNHYLHRLAVIFLTFAPTFVILSISYEGIFYVVFSITLVAWVRLEHAGHTYTLQPGTPEATNGHAAATTAATGTQGAKAEAPSKFRPLMVKDARVALFYLVLIQSAFFSTGNVASVSSFSLESVNRLQPVFDPLTQGALLMVKLMVPFALVSANVGILNRRLGITPSALFMVVVAVSDVLTLYFFWVVKDEGSWLEIGSTISHFFIASLLCVFLVLLEGVSALFVSGVEVGGTEGAAGESKGAVRQEEEEQALLAGDDEAATMPAAASLGDDEGAGAAEGMGDGKKEGANEGATVAEDAVVVE